MDAFSCYDSYMGIQAVDGRSESEPPCNYLMHFSAICVCLKHLAQLIWRWKEW